MKLNPFKKKNQAKPAKKKKAPVTSVESDINMDDYQGNKWDVIFPSGLKIDDEDHGVVKHTLGSKTYFRPFYIPREGYPRKMQTNWLYDITSSGEVDVSIDVHKIKQSEAMKMLQKKITMLKSNLAFQLKRGNEDQIKEIETKISDNDNLMNEIQFSDNDAFHVSVVGNLYSQSKRELDRYSEYLEDEMSGKFIKLAPTWERVKNGFRTVLPLGNNELKDTYRNIDRRSLSTFAPFISGSGRFNGGIPLGNNMITGQKEFYNAFGNQSHDAPEYLKYDNYNQAVFGTSGSGKSLAVKLMLARETVGLDQYTRIIDVEKEFVKITKRLGGINLTISEESDIRINPLAINVSNIPIDDDYDDEELELIEEGDEKKIITKEGKRYISFVPLREKQNEALTFFDIICRGKNGEEEGLTVFERNYLEESFNFIFEKKEFTTHPDSLYENKVREIDGKVTQSRVRKSEPTISDVYAFLRKKYGQEPKAERLIAAIRPFLKDGSKPIFDGQTNLGKNVTQSLDEANIVNFDISGMEEGFLQPIAYHVILNYNWEYFVKNVELAQKRKVLLADEAWTLIDNDMTVSFLEKMARRSRKRNAGLRIASQDFVRFLENEKARGVIQNSFSYFFLGQKPLDRRALEENFDLSQGELNIIFGSPLKGEGILKVGKSSVWIRTDPSDEEFAFVESNQAVLDQMMERKKQSRLH